MNEGRRNELAAWSQNVAHRIERPLQIGYEVEHVASDDNVEAAGGVPGIFSIDSLVKTTLVGDESPSSTY